MKSRLVALALAAAACAHGYTYGYDYSPVVNTFWYQNGTIDSWSPTARFYSAGSIIYGPVISGANPNDYEIKTQIAIKAAGGAGGTFIHYLRASTDALALPTSCAGSYYSVEIYVPYGSGYYTNPSPAQIHVRRCNSGTLSTVAGTSLAVWDGATLRSVVWGTTLWVYVDGHLVMQQTLSSTTGKPGIGGYGQASYDSGFLGASIGPHDTFAPGTVSSTGIRASIFPNSVSLDWQGAVDDTSNFYGGIGVYGYNITRNGMSLGMVTGASYSNSTVSSSTSYTYTIAAVDFHGNTRIV